MHSSIVAGVKPETLITYRCFLPPPRPPSPETAPPREVANLGIQFMSCQLERASISQLVEAADEINIKR